MKKLTIAILLALALLAAACTTPPVKKADKNFERAWLAYLTLRTDQAADYFTDAAEFYEEALAEEPPSRVAQYPSSRVKAGIANYFAGRHEQCIESMVAARRSGERLWEADLFTALAHARLGDRDNTVGNLALFLEGRTMMQSLNNVVRTQMTALQEGVDTIQVAEVVETAAQAQIIDTIRRTTSPNTIQPSTEKCDGAFWWRRNKQPCSARRDTGN